MIQPHTTVTTDLTIKTLFGPKSHQQYKDSIQEALTYIEGFLQKDNFYSGARFEDLHAMQSQISLQQEDTISTSVALAQLKEIYLDHAISFHAPTYVAHLNCPVAIPAITAELIANSVNTAVETWDQSTSATLIEQEVINWACKQFNLPETADGVFTSGGTQSNFKALLMARDHYAFRNFGINVKENGWDYTLNKFRIFCSEKAHFSIKKNAALLGMGYQSVIPIPTNDAFEMRADALVQAIEKEQQKGNIPIAVVGTAGTTDFGSFDPLMAIAQIAKAHGMWFHVDGAYGGCYVLTNTHKHLLKAAQYADSITIDFHKTLFQPVCSSAFLVANKDHFKYVSHYADYLNPIEQKDTTAPNLIEKSIQTTRRFDALKLWMTLKVVGANSLGSFLERVHHLALEVYEILQHNPLIEVAHKPSLSTIVFRYIAPGISDDNTHNMINLHIKNRLFKNGEASIASTKLNGKTYLKFTLLNPNTTITQLSEIVAMIIDKGINYKRNN